MCPLQFCATESMTKRDTIQSILSVRPHIHNCIRCILRAKIQKVIDTLTATTLGPTITENIIITLANSRI